MGPRAAPFRYGISAVLFALALGVGCESSEPPAPPQSLPSSDKSGSSGDATEKNIKASSNDGSGDGGTSSSEQTSGSKLGGTGKNNKGYNHGILKVLYSDSGSDAEKKAFTDCADGGKFYDRFPAGGGSGNCGSLDLADIECTDTGVKAVLTSGQKAQYASQMSSDYLGYQIDQCLDCPPDGDDDACTKKDASGNKTKQTGTKLFMVKNDAGTIRGKAIVIPERPGK